MTGPAGERDAYEVLQVRPDAEQVVVVAAYRALASLYHPDRDASPRALRMMAALNVAFDKVRTRDRREVYDRLRKAGARAKADAPGVIVPAGGSTVPPRTTPRAGDRTLDFGRYAGWTIQQLARHDPDYLRWLSRHSAGLRFRSEIEEALRQK